MSKDSDIIEQVTRILRKGGTSYGIERKMQQIDQLYRKEWISVDDRQPEYGQRVLVFMFDNYRQCAVWFDHWITDDKSGQVTHWMLLPEPPIKQELSDD